jgi:transcriptional regulator with XRE-family HTH domain
MPGPTRTTDQILSHRQTIAERYLRGDYQADIAQDLGISQQQVSYDLKAIRAQWIAATIRDFDAAKAQELAKIDQVEAEYWKAWARSQEDKEISYSETGVKGSKSGSRSEGQAGNPAFLDGVLKCITKRCEILGLDAPKRFTINWDDLTPEQEERLAKGEPPEKVLNE